MNRPISATFSAVLFFAAASASAQNTSPARASPPTGSGQSAAAAESEFKRLAGQLVELRLSGAEESELGEEQPLEILDGFVLEALNGAGEPNLETLNQRLAALVTQQPPAGEGFRAISTGSSPAVFLLAANFGVSGPSAVRLYARGSKGYRLAGRIDRFVQPEFFDDYLEVVPLTSPAGAGGSVFITITGRTDELSTGMFSAWRYDQERLQSLWSSDLLPRSSYEARPDGFRLSYCAEPDEDHPKVCRRMTSDHYVWDGIVWKRVEQTSLPLPRP